MSLLDWEALIDPTRRPFSLFTISLIAPSRLGSFWGGSIVAYILLRVIAIKFKARVKIEVRVNSLI